MVKVLLDHENDDRFPQSPLTILEGHVRTHEGNLEHVKFTHANIF